MAKVIIEYSTSKNYLNDRDVLHREDGPAVIWPTGLKWWYDDGIAIMSHTSSGVYNRYVNDTLSLQEWPNGIKRSIDRSTHRTNWPVL